MLVLKPEQGSAWLGNNQMCCRFLSQDILLMEERLRTASMSSVLQPMPHMLPCIQDSGGAGGRVGKVLRNLSSSAYTQGFLLAYEPGTWRV